MASASAASSLHANYRFLALLAEFDRRKGWNCRATRDCAHWLNWKCGIALGAAREKVRTARALEKLPLVSAAMERGEISYSNVRAITRVATPENEHYFVQIALHGTAHHVETLVRAYRHAEVQELSRERQQQMNREVRYYWDYDGFIPPDSIDRPSWSHKRADALAVIFESFLAHGAEAMSGGERHQVVVHVSAETLRAGGGDQCEIEDGPAVAAETARRLACDASVVAIVENEKSEPLNVGRKTRSIPPALSRALRARDGGCRYPGCDRTRFTEGHHVKHWADGGETKLGNLVTLCRFHHRLVHEGGYGIVAPDDGVFVFTRPDGRRVEPNGARSFRGNILEPTATLPALNRDVGLAINAQTCRTQWRGERMDYSMAIEAIQFLEQKATTLRVSIKV